MTIYRVKTLLGKKDIILYKLESSGVILTYNSRHTMGYSSGGYLNLTLSDTTKWYGDFWVLFYLD